MCRLRLPRRPASYRQRRPRHQRIVGGQFAPGLGRDMGRNLERHGGLETLLRPREAAAASFRNGFFSGSLVEAGNGIRIEMAVKVEPKIKAITKGTMWPL